MSLLIFVLCIATLVICCITLSRVKRLAFYLRRMPVGIQKKRKASKVVNDSSDLDDYDDDLPGDYF